MCTWSSMLQPVIRYLFLLLVQYKGGLSEIEFTVTLFSNASMVFLPFSQILCIFTCVKGGIVHFC